ncbi:hypothetical protein [Haliangium sp. UPWRP_2]|uniref:hypothetical protein n=1 Tax=Haliangium sp. UPWRP_2 TaxID=1931276 RepID=UPI0011B24A52|nr:hypothetical protein [Haliangium sp. UPWRP_2]
MNNKRRIPNKAEDQAEEPGIEHRAQQVLVQVGADGLDVGAVEEVQAGFVDVAAASVPVVGIVQHRPQGDEQGRKRQQIDAEEAQGGGLSQPALSEAQLGRRPGSRPGGRPKS